MSAPVIITRLFAAWAAAKAHLGSLDRISKVVGFGVYMTTVGDFVDHAKVADAAKAAERLWK